MYQFQFGLLRQRDAIKASRDRWLGQYKSKPDDALTGWNARETFGDIRKKLAVLDLETCSADDVALAMGMAPSYGSWASYECDRCGARADPLVRLGESPSYEARWLDLCEKCLSAAMSIFDAEVKA